MGKAERLAAWRGPRTEELTLPSGLTVTVRRVMLLDVVADGQLPKPLLGMVDEIQKAGKVQFAVSELAQYMPLIDATVGQAIVDPPLAAEPDDEHLALSELPANDRLAIFNWMNAPAAVLAPFRAEQGGAVAAAPGGADVQQPAERTAGDRERLAGVPGGRGGDEPGQPGGEHDGGREADSG